MGFNEMSLTMVRVMGFNFWASIGIKGDKSVQAINTRLRFGKEIRLVLKVSKNTQNAFGLGIGDPNLVAPLARPDMVVVEDKTTESVWLYLLPNLTDIRPEGTFRVYDFYILFFESGAQMVCDFRV